MYRIVIGYYYWMVCEASVGSQLSVWGEISLWYKKSCFKKCYINCAVISSKTSLVWWFKSHSVPLTWTLDSATH